MFPADSFATADDDQMARTTGAATTTAQHEPIRIPSPIDAASRPAGGEEIEGGEAGGIRQAAGHGETIAAISGADIDGRAIGAASIGDASPDR